MTADYSFDYADRETSLSVTTPSGTTDVVADATYLPSGPLSKLTFCSGAWEDRAFNSRYFPDSIVLTASRGRTWTYSTDAVGNPTEIVETVSCPGDLTLANATVTTAEFYESCDGITTGPDYTVAAGGELDLRAATRIVFTDGFRVEASGTLSAGVDPTLDDDVTKTYAYQDVDYFLAAATGPWGTQSWTYDKIGNRLTETDNGATDTYSYTANGTGGNTARLSTIDLATFGTRSYTYTAAGHVEDVTAGANVVDFTWDDAGRLAASDRSTNTAAFLYDGRGFLRQGGEAAGPGTVFPTYDSSGLLHCLQRQIPTGTTDYHVFYLAGRPVGQVALESGQPERWWYFTTDHLGTPVVGTDGNQDELWVNRFDPFGEDPFAGTPGGASEQEIFLRFPGQWDDPVWREAMMGAEGYQNVWRWYETGIGRFSRTDPLGLFRPNLYAYATTNPITFLDPLGLREIIFTGCEAWFTDDDGNFIKTCPASSGVPGSGVDDQKIKYHGPIPAGEYTLHPREFSGGLRSILRAPGWGKWRAPLHPTDNTETYGRDGFFLHGDTRSEPGSLGCVDIADCDTWARDWAMERPDEPIPFYVYYTNEVCT